MPCAHQKICGVLAQDFPVDQTCALLDMLVKTPVRLSRTIMTKKPETMVANGDFAPHELLTAERENEPVVVYELKRAPTMFAYPMARSS